LIAIRGRNSLYCLPAEWLLDSMPIGMSRQNGELVAIDVGDPINPNQPREEVGETAIRQAMIQQRPCVRGRMWRKTIYHPKEPFIRSKISASAVIL